MTLHVEAIYQGGVFRPLVPIALPENQVVSLTITLPVAAELQETEEEEGARQRAVMLAYIASVEAKPIDPPDDGLSNRDHDKIIYGDIR